MAKFAPVAPVQILMELQRQRNFGDYHLFLAHHTVERADEFLALMMQDRSHKYTSPYDYKRTIIMDNSIVELGGAVDDQMILEAVKIIKPDMSLKVIPCLPDVMGSASGTHELTEAAYSRWEAMDMRQGFPHGYMMVSQGATFEEFAALVNYFLVIHAHKFRWITWVGIPRYILKQWPEKSRQRAVAYLRMMRPDVHLHLLGFSDDIMDDMLCARMKGVTGIDSAVPVRYDAPLFPTTTPEEIGPRDNSWFAEGGLTARQLENIRQVRRWAEIARHLA